MLAVHIVHMCTCFYIYMHLYAPIDVYMFMCLYALVCTYCMQVAKEANNDILKYRIIKALWRFLSPEQQRNPQCVRIRAFIWRHHEPAVSPKMPQYFQ